DRVEQSPVHGRAKQSAVAVRSPFEEGVGARLADGPLCFLLLPERPAQGQTKPTCFSVLAVDRRWNALCSPGGSRAIAAHGGLMSGFRGCVISTRCDVAVRHRDRRIPT